MKNFLFLLRTDPDVDHIAPVIWKCLEQGDQVVAVFAQPYAFERDYRIRFLFQYSNFKVLTLIGVTAKSPLVRLLSRVLWNYYAIRLLLRRYRISGCFFEWGEGVRSVSTRPLLERPLHRFLKDIRVQLFHAATELGIPTFCLPHGLNTKLNIDTNAYIAGILEQNDGHLPFEDRNLFTAYVFNTEYHRQSYLRHARMDSAVSQTWGSIRFCPEWMGVLDRICPPQDCLPHRNSKMRLLFFLPKWHNRVDKSSTLRLIESLAHRADVQLILKTHPRKGNAELEQDTLEKLLCRENVVLAKDVPSPSLIKEADVVIDVGSSIAIEAILQQKSLIYPRHLHANRLIFDEVGGCLIADDDNQVHRYLDAIAESRPSANHSDDAAVIREVVYGGREAYDVPAFYYSKIMQYVDGNGR